MKKSCHNLSGKKLQACQKTAKRELQKEYGGDYDVLFGWNRTQIDEKVGKIVPIPPQTDMFVDFKKKDAEKLRDELLKLKNEPVVVTGGGGSSYHFAFLEEASLIHCSHPPLRNPFNQFIVRDEKGKVVLDATKPIQCSIQAKLKMFDKIHGGKKFTPHIGSWRITALHGYGSNRLMEKVPRNWEKD